MRTHPSRPAPSRPCPSGPPPSGAPASRIRAGMPAAIVGGLMAALAWAVLPSAALHAQSAREVLERAAELHRERMEGVENYTVTQEVMGFESTTYFERVERDGDSFFAPRARTGSAAGERAPENPYAVLDRLAGRAALEGVEEMDGETCHVVTVADLEGTDLFGPAGGAGEFEPERATFLVDVDDHLVRAMRLAGTAVVAEESRDVSFEALFRDYREVGGLLHPFRTEVSTTGLGAGMSEEERREARRSMEEMRKQMAEMSDRQRAMMERMMGGQMERFERMLATGAMDFAVEVTEIRVNEGPPGGEG